MRILILTPVDYDFHPRSAAIKAKILYISKKLLLNLYFWPLFLLTTIMVLVFIPPSAYVAAWLKQRPSSTFFRKGIRLYGWFVVRCIPFMAPIQLIDKSGGYAGPVIFVANHLSVIEPYCFGMVNAETSIISKAWPFNIPFFRYQMNHAEYINSQKGWEFMQKQTHHLLNKNCNILIWPEGNRSKDGKLGTFHRGAFRLAVEAKCPIVPVCFVDTDKVMAPGCHFLSPHRPKVILLEPLTPDPDDTPRRAVKKLCQQTFQCISHELAQQQQGS